ncbi:MAG: carotenoid biosynthesis protein [Bacteroidetes bacterium]|nr:carotenoid biosynthesis protein [Bacteroidota bacterium]
MTFIKKHIPLIIIIVFHIVGFVGFMVNPVYFKSLSPVNLLLSAGLVILMSEQRKWSFYGALILVAILGFLVEVLGVKTELVFGSYHYGNALGYKLYAVPLLIGINWSILLYSTAQLSKFKNGIVNALFGAFLMVGLDFFIEQNASKFDFWYWKGNNIPLQNYLAWFIISFLLNCLVQKHLAQKSNLTAQAFYMVQLAFFSALYWFV